LSLLKNNKFILAVITFLFVIVLLSSSNNVAASGAKLDFFGNPSYTCYKETDAGYYYYIYVTISNTGDTKSCPIDIKLLEDGYTTVWPNNCRNVTFEPGEQKTFTFDWPTFSANDEVEIKFQANNPLNITADTSGIKTVNVIYKGSNDSQGTPGFVFLGLLISLFVILIIKKKK
jgi:hypothetical protein